MLLISVLVSMAVAMALFASWMKTISLEREQMRAQQIRLQAEYLADSGLGRAAAQLAADINYVGETWRIAPDSLAGRGATVEIRVTSADQRRARKVRVVANYPAEGLARAQRSREITITLKKSGEAP
jgi:type II secretory pathway component PulK